MTKSSCPEQLLKKIIDVQMEQEPVTMSILLDCRMLADNCPPDWTVTRKRNTRLAYYSLLEYWKRPSRESDEYQVELIIRKLAVVDTEHEKRDLNLALEHFRRKLVEAQL